MQVLFQNLLLTTSSQPTLCVNTVVTCQYEGEREGEEERGGSKKGEERERG